MTLLLISQASNYCLRPTLRVHAPDTSRISTIRTSTWIHVAPSPPTPPSNHPRYPCAPAAVTSSQLCPRNPPPCCGLASVASSTSPSSSQMPLPYSQKTDSSPAVRPLVHASLSGPAPSPTTAHHAPDRAINRRLPKNSRLALPKSMLTRILAVGWGLQAEPAFGGVQDTTSVKAKVIHLIASVRTLMRGPLIVVNTLIILYEIILG
ncbi:hypothetical protein IWZ00DRAFT_169642 [Phyllosticta capitalensis]